MIIRFSFQPGGQAGKTIAFKITGDPLFYLALNRQEEQQRQGTWQQSDSSAAHLQDLSCW
jgi:hypothetical protein